MYIYIYIYIHFSSTLLAASTGIPALTEHRCDGSIRMFAPTLHAKEHIPGPRIECHYMGARRRDKKHFPAIHNDEHLLVAELID